MIKQNKGLIKIIGLILVIIILQSLLIHSVLAETDTRIVVSEVEGTSLDIDTMAVFGSEIKAPNFTVTKGEPAYFYTRWRKMAEKRWRKLGRC